MAIINRIARLFKADIHAVLDQIEEPELLLKQSIREMQNELDATDRNLSNAKAGVLECEQQLGELDKSIDDLSDEIELCLTSQNEELARKLIRRRIELQRFVTTVSQTLKSNHKQVAELTTIAAEQKEALEGMKQKAELLCQKAEHTDSPLGGCNTSNFSAKFEVSDSEVEIDLLKEKRRLS